MSPDEKWVLLASNKKKVTPCKMSRLFSSCHRSLNCNVWLRSKEMFGNQRLLDCLLSFVTFSIFPRLSRDACDFTKKGSVQCCDWLLLGYFPRASDNQSVTPNGFLLRYVASRSGQPWHSAAMLVLNLPAFENKKYTLYDSFHGNGPYGEIPTKKEPIRTLGFASPYNKRILFRVLNLNRAN